MTDYSENLKEYLIGSRNASNTGTLGHKFQRGGFVCLNYKVEPTRKMSESLLIHMCYLNFHPEEYRRGYIFINYFSTLCNIFQTIRIGSFNIIYIRGVITRKGSICITSKSSVGSGSLFMHISLKIRVIVVIYH